MILQSEARLITPRHPVKRGEPAWDIALLFPPQGQWTEEEYLALDTNWLIELSDGCIEVLPMPTPLHQFIVKFLFELLNTFVTARGLGDVLFAPLPTRLWSGKLREPDILFLRAGRIPDPNKPPDGADLVMEVVSGKKRDRQRDLVTKRREYARAGIAENWIVDPKRRRITVLRQDGTKYSVHGDFGPVAQASSALLPGFSVPVAEVFARVSSAVLKKTRKRPGSKKRSN